MPLHSDLLTDNNPPQLAFAKHQDKIAAKANHLEVESLSPFASFAKAQIKAKLIKVAES